MRRPGVGGGGDAGEARRPFAIAGAGGQQRAGARGHGGHPVSAIIRQLEASEDLLGFGNGRQSVIDGEACVGEGQSGGFRASPTGAEHEPSAERLGSAQIGDSAAVEGHGQLGVELPIHSSAPGANQHRHGSGREGRNRQGPGQAAHFQLCIGNRPVRPKRRGWIRVAGSQ